MIEIGKKQFLKVSEEDQSGYYLLCSDNREVFMPGSLGKKNYEAGEMIEVFVWMDKDGNELATPNLPKYEVDDLALLTVTHVGANGLFLDLGIPKDLIVPKRFQKGTYEKDDLCLVKILIDEDGRLYGSCKLSDYFGEEPSGLKSRQIVEIIPFKKTPLGYKVLINSEREGMIYHNEIFEQVKLGETYQGSIKFMRKDGLIDVLLKKIGKEAVDDDIEKIKKALNNNAGQLSLTDKSSPEEIKKKLNISKKAFKKAVGAMYKQRIISLHDTHIELTIK